MNQRRLILLASLVLLACQDDESILAQQTSYGGSSYGGSSSSGGNSGASGAGGPGGSSPAGAAGASAGQAGAAGAAGQGDGGQGGASGGGTSGAGGEAPCEPLPWGTSWEQTGIQLPTGAASWSLYSTQEGVIAVTDMLRFFRLDGDAFVDLGEPSFSEPMKGSGGLLARDEARKEFLLFGNGDIDLTTGESTLYEDTWTLALSDMTWKKRCAPCGVAPAAQTIGYDKDRARVILISEDTPATGLGIPSVSEWDGNAWTTACGPGKQACPFGNATPWSQAYDQARKSTTLLTLTMGNKNVMETWTYDASKPELERWVNHKTPVGSKATFQPIEYDEVRQRVTQNTGTFGGHEWDGSCWTQVENKEDTLFLSLSSIVHVSAEKRSLALASPGIDEQGNLQFTLLSRVDP